MTVKPLCVLVTGQPVAPVRERFGGFDNFFASALGANWTHGIEALDAQSDGLDARSFEKYSGVIVSGSPSSVTERAPWMLRAEALMRSLVEREVPLLGVCFGHQLLASALGGEVRKNPAGRKLGTHRVSVHNTDDPLFNGLPREFAANVSHEDHVGVRPTHTALVHLAESPHDAFHAFRVGNRGWGVQFHPEFSRTITEGYVHARRELLVNAGLEPDEILANLQETPWGPKLLANFVNIVESDHRASR